MKKSAKSDPKKSDPKLFKEPDFSKTKDLADKLIATSGLSVYGTAGLLLCIDFSNPYSIGISLAASVILWLPTIYYAKQAKQAGQDKSWHKAVNLVPY